MRLEIVRYTCANCGEIFEVPEIGENAYGEFLLRSPSGQILYLDAIQDKTYEEVDQLLARHPKTSSLQPFDRATVLQRVYGELACDRDLNGNPFALGARPECPRCGNQKMASWEFKSPVELVDLRLKPVMHATWNALSAPEKIAQLNKIIG